MSGAEVVEQAQDPAGKAAPDSCVPTFERARCRARALCRRRRRACGGLTPGASGAIDALCHRRPAEFIFRHRQRELHTGMLGLPMSRLVEAGATLALSRTLTPAAIRGATE